jgi:hypothetical protein
MRRTFPKQEEVTFMAKPRSSAAQTQDVSLWARISRKKGRFQSENVQDVDQPGVV